MFKVLNVGLINNLSELQIPECSLTLTKQFQKKCLTNEESNGETNSGPQRISTANPLQGKKKSRYYRDRISHYDKNFHLFFRHFLLT